MANEKRVNTRIQLKIDTTDHWTVAGNNGFIPKAGEPIVYQENSYDDNGEPVTQMRLKIGDGVTKVHELKFIQDQGIIAIDPDGDGQIQIYNVSQLITAIAEGARF